MMQRCEFLCTPSIAVFPYEVTIFPEMKNRVFFFLSLVAKGHNLSLRRRETYFFVNRYH